MKVEEFPVRKPVVEAFAEELKELVYRYTNRLAVAEVIGTIEVVKLEIFKEQT
jgi:hypothetical protein